VRWEDPTTWVVSHLPWSEDHPRGTADCPPPLLRLTAQELGLEPAVSSVTDQQNITASEPRQGASPAVSAHSDTTDPLVSTRYLSNFDRRHISKVVEGNKAQWIIRPTM